jgi:hypothetical protein
MRTSQRVSRGFHRLAIFFAGIPLMVGVIVSVMTAMGNANPLSLTLCQSSFMIVEQM